MMMVGYTCFGGNHYFRFCEVSAARPAEGWGKEMFCAALNGDWALLQTLLDAPRYDCADEDAVEVVIPILVNGIVRSMHEALALAQDTAIKRQGSQDTLIVRRGEEDEDGPG